MEFKNFIDNLSKCYHLAPDHREFLQAHLQRKRYARNEFLVKQHQVPSRLFFLGEGLVRAYYVDEAGVEINNWFAYQQQLIGNVQDVLSKHKSTENIQAVRGSIIYYLTHEDVQLFMHRFARSDLIRLYNTLVSAYWQQVKDRSYCRDGSNHQERILRFNEIMPNGLHQLKQNHIASYLGMTRERLNRLLKKVD
jgi:CRP-like cAMP-binding protein